MNDNIHVNTINIQKNLTVQKNATVDMGNNVVQNVADDKVSRTSKQTINGSQLYQVQQQIHNQHNTINRLDGHINDVDRKLRAGIAGATAIGFIQRPNLPSKSMVSVEFGGYRSESAIAVGYARNSDNDKISTMVAVLAINGRV